MRPHRGKGGRRSVGIRELKANLSAFIHVAAAGQRFEVTDRGRPVVDFGPHEPSPVSEAEIERRLAAMVKRGWLLPAASTDTSFLRKWKGLGLSRKQIEALRRDFEWSREDKF
jgi:antitoxin (DNA-binding transcriptional repressor) of toxin-antitoxin stability system